jgi:predicted peptidase
MSQENRTFKAPITKTANLKYLLYVPTDYASRDKWPLMIFLHGYGERGDDLELIKKHGLPKLIEAGQEFPFIIASPQCPDTTVWPEQVDELHALVEALTAEHKVDPNRVYLTGLSMGGYGTWYLASRYPQTFAAIAAICGGGGWWMTDALKNLPIWVFHGDEDPLVPLIESEIMVNRIKEAGGDVTFTVYPGVAHDSWTETYENPELYKWLLSHKRK